MYVTTETSMKNLNLHSWSPKPILKLGTSKILQKNSTIYHHYMLYLA